MINVTKTFTPPLDEYQSLVKRAFDNQWLTNRGELVKELETKIIKKLNVPNVILMTNGTIPIQIALKLFGKGGEIITTPFSYVATTSSIVWENCTPIFVDIHPDYLTIDEDQIENAITSKTTCILATHVFGNPCNIEKIQEVATKYNLTVIYDAAHCFGVNYKGQSIFNYGDISTCSFHATKIFHTAEGGALFSNNNEILHKAYFSHNFGHNGPENFHGLGINGKMSELQAAMGLAVLPYFDTIVSNRKRIVELYQELLDFNQIKSIKLRDNTEWNYSYYPIIFESEEILLNVLKALNDENIFPRRYFYPSLNLLPYVKSNKMKNSESIASRIMCLPLYQDLDPKNVLKIINIINSNLNE